MDYKGYVRGIDVVATQDEPVSCFALIGYDESDYIQVRALYPQLQTALQLASAKNVEVEVSYVEQDNQRIVERVRFMDN